MFYCKKFGPCQRSFKSLLKLFCMNETDVSSSLHYTVFSRFVLGIVECNGGVAEEDEVEVILAQKPTADQEVPREAVLPEQSPGEFDFNEFFNLEKVPCLASVSIGGHLQMWMEQTVKLNLS